MDENNKEFFGIFVEEMKDLLEAMDEYIMNLEDELDNKDHVNNLFRVAHSIKGMTATMGFHKLSKLTHTMEDLLHDVRDDKIKVGKKLIDVLFLSHDYLLNSLEYIIYNQNEEENNSKFDLLISKLHEIVLKDTKEKIKEKNNELSNFFELNKKEIKNMEEIMENIKNAFKLIVNFKDNCKEKSIRSFMILNKLIDFSKIIKAEPSLESIKKDPKIHIKDFRAVICSNEKQEFIKAELNDILDIKEIVVNDFSFDKTIDILPNTDMIIGLDALNFSLEKEFEEELRLALEKNIKLLKGMENDFEDTKNLRLLYRNLHTIEGFGRFLNLIIIEYLAKKTENIINSIKKKYISMNEDIYKLLIKTNNYLIDIFEDTELISDKDFLKDLDIHLHNLDDLSHKNLDKKTGKRLGEILVEHGILTEDEVEEIALIQKVEAPNLKFGEVVVKEHKAEAYEIVEAINLQKNKTPEKLNTYIKVNIDKIDALVDNIGELMILQLQAEQDFLLGKKKTNKFLQVNRITKDIQNMTMSLKMVSLHSSLQKLNRVHRDTVKELNNKEVDFEYLEDNAIIDRSIAEKITDPLMHMLKNSISHGIESSPEERIVNGKSRRGKVTLKAYNKKGNVYIELEDDGQGIVPEKIYKKALEKNLIDKDKNYSDDEIVNLIFATGFSTAENINSISGRGVGMDVVRTEISKIGGKVEINNKPGLGCKFTLKIPINMASMNGTIVLMNEEKFIVPTLSIKEVYHPKNSDWISIAGKKSKIKIRDNIINIVPINKIFDLDDLKKNILVILEFDNKLKALPVDSIIGRSEIVVKSLDNELNKLNFISGASILGDGLISLILDVEALINLK